MTLWTNTTKGLNRERPNRGPYVKRGSWTAEASPFQAWMRLMAALHNGKTRCTPLLTVGCLCYCRLHPKMYAFSCLQILNDLDKIVSFRVAGRPKHAHETLWINVDSLS
jgi:hypothetical protein